MDASSWNNSSVQRAERSYEKQVSLHNGKISNPREYDSSWDRKTTAQQDRLLKKWQKDADRNSELRVVMEYILQKRRMPDD